MPGCNIKMICDVMTNASIGKPIDRLAVLRKGQQSWLNDAEISVNIGSGDADYWGWQTCTESVMHANI